MKEAKESEVEILLGDKGYFDLSYPVHMTESQKSAFINLLKGIYDPSVVLETEVNEFTRDWRIGERKLYPREWTPEEYHVLLGAKTTKNIVESLGRSWYASQLKDADWRYKFLSWYEKNKERLSKKSKLEAIKEFIKEHEAEMKGRRAKRSRLRELLKVRESMESPERQKILKEFKRMGQKTKVKEFEKDLMEISDEVERLEKSLEE